MPIALIGTLGGAAAARLRVQMAQGRKEDETNTGSCAITQL